MIPELSAMIAARTDAVATIRRNAANLIKIANELHAEATKIHKSMFADIPTGTLTDDELAELPWRQICRYRDQKWDCRGGSNISGCIDEMIVLANLRGETVEMDFNGTPVVAPPGADGEAVFAAWNAEFDRRYRTSK